MPVATGTLMGENECPIVTLRACEKILVWREIRPRFSYETRRKSGSRVNKLTNSEPFGHAQDGLREGSGVVGALLLSRALPRTAPDSSPEAQNDMFRSRFLEAVRSAIFTAMTPAVPSSMCATWIVYLPTPMSPSGKKGLLRQGPWLGPEICGEARSLGVEEPATSPLASLTSPVIRSLEVGPLRANPPPPTSACALPRLLLGGPSPLPDGHRLL